jgi:serine/threonine protein kinase
MLVVERSERHNVAEVRLLNDDLRYFFKHVNRKPKESTIQEISALAKVRHQYIVPLTALVLNASGVVIGLLFPFAERGSLKETVNQLAPISQKVLWVLDIISALEYIAAKGQTYEDIKAPNIVVFDHGIARLTDFDGGTTLGHFRRDLDCYGLGVLLEDLKCVGEGMEELIQHAKKTKMTLTEFRTSLEGTLNASNI